jgi:hypothetical protein
MPPVPSTDLKLETKKDGSMKQYEVVGLINRNPL